MCLTERQEQVRVERFAGEIFAEVAKLGHFGIGVPGSAIDDAGTRNRIGKANAEVGSVQWLLADMTVQRARREVQVFGGLGCIRGCAVERLYHDAEIIKIFGDTGRVQRWIIARDLMKKGARR